ncbi:GlcG/HbpS family heme-binding protein [Sphingomonas bacterium]|uniref:GlcG/HbpS family heme-binding protein n=1 Tax=Sphingomonas bacterium TaxID=1895847 RepID=UPI0015750B0D|nr:heme-binding protein [Sphingomonas bacterium]
MKALPLLAAALIASPGSAPAQTAAAATTAFPGDLGRPFDGLPLPPNPAEHHLPWPSMPGPARGPSMAVAMLMAQGAVAACTGQHIGVSVIDASGLPKLYYITDGAPGYHAYTGFRKAYTALTFRMPTSSVGAMTRNDAAAAARITADTNLLAFSGGVPIVVGNEVIGAIGVSGVEPRPGDRSDPGLGDERCARAGLDKVKGLLG